MEAEGRRDHPSGGVVYLGPVERVEHVTALIEREGDGFVALCPEFDIASQGNTIEEARSNLQETLELFLESASAQEIAERFRSEVYVTALDIAVG